MADDSGMFTNARTIEQIVWQMRLAEYPRGLDRSRIDSLANGAPPYPEAEAEENGIEVNVNDLTMTRLSHEARMQLYQAFQKPDNYFTMTTDGGVAEKRQERSHTITRLINRHLKRSLPYYEAKRSKFAGLVLHGIGPSNWATSDRWRPTPVAQADVLIPSRTLLTFDNLPFFAIFRAYTATELKRLVRRVDHPGWNMKAFNAAVKWADEQTAKLFGGANPTEYWNPEKWEARFKDDAGIYASDLAQTIDVWDFYYWDDYKGREGWRRRIVFDAWGGRSSWLSDYGPNNRMPERNLIERETGRRSNKGQFLFTSGNRVVADSLSDIIHFQFADLSCVQPFTYHGVRSLGFLLYAACHLQNRLRCASWEANFENLMMYFRVHSLDEAERALKVEMVRRGVLDESVRFLPPAERWQPDHQFTMVGLGELKQIIQENSASYVQNQNWSRDRTEKTKFQVMAEVNAMQTLVSSGLQQAYTYERAEYETIVKRFMNPDSNDPAVKEFRGAALDAGVPAKLLTPGAWDVQPERIWGAGNKTMEMQVASQLMEWRAAYSPQAQEAILRKATLALTDNADEAQVLVPRQPPVSDTQHAAMSDIGALMSGARVLFPASMNRLELAETLVAELGAMIDDTMREGGMASQDRINGFLNVLAHVRVIIKKLAQDPALKETVKQLSQRVAAYTNQVKAFQQRLDEQQQAQAAGGNGEAAAEMAKLKLELETMDRKAQVQDSIRQRSHVQRTAERQVQADLETQQRETTHAQDLRHKAEDHALDVAAKAAETEANLRATERRADSQQGGKGE